MRAFLYGVFLQWKLDIRSRTLLITCYLVPLLFFAMMGGIFTSVMPETRHTLIQSMTVFGVTMGALIGLPPSLVEIYRGDIKKVYQANGVPRCLGLALTNLSACIHLFIMSLMLYVAAPLVFNAKTPENPGAYFFCLAVYMAVSLGVASVIGLAVKDPAKTPMLSIAVFLPSTILSGIMFPTALLPKGLAILGRMFPAFWGYGIMTDSTCQPEKLLPLLAMFILAVFACILLLGKTDT
ncbi:MAG TPA: ABC transporter permease [Candidatus Avichristensenella intestinipullorum]|uniref:ABC transporter permease n=1 Tax=Candidatus Avichristensenella intestinipullorum TaxID=2840693 RepID=A0A9D0YWZ9_9FIRM|nr:ABC transporter permease [Candidatus Avichristensenella intestinipullorum]